MLPKGKVGEFRIDGVMIPVYINLNTAAQFDKIADTSLNSLIGKIWAAFGSKKQSNITVQEVLSVVDWSSMLVLASASLHSYNGNLEAKFYYTPSQLGAGLDMEEWSELLTIILKGLGDYMVRGKDVPRSIQKGGGESSEQDPTPTQTAEKEKSDGGETSTGLDAATLDSLEKVSVEKPSEDSTSDGAPGKSESSDKN